MKKLLKIFCVMIGILLITACSDKPVKETVKEKKPAETVTENGTTEGTENNSEDQLEEKEEYSQVFNIFLDKKMEEEFKQLVGADIDIFRVTFQQIAPVPVEDDKLFAFHGYIPGLEGVAEGIIIFDESGKIWAAVAEADNVNIYHNGDENEKHQPVLEDWRKQFFSGHTIVYK